ncbi:MAG: DegT/DnrJ/EryC1/StrS family aminotransferase [Anaerolineales bacterium]|nr:DegT/DnrJ/EryC1/StrS family aminotransferase [Anaerolineales bacterium]
MNYKVAMSSPDLTELEQQAVAEVLQTPRLSMGPRLEAFEGAIAQRVGLRHAIAVNSGTAGLHLCVRAAGIADGDVVITSPFSFVASSNVLLYERAIPVFVDVDPVTGNLDPAQVAAAAADLAEGGKRAKRWLPRRGVAARVRLRGLLTVDVFGQPADHDPLAQTARDHGLTLIEDSCEALGAAYRGRPAGTLGDLAVFAFYPNKQITSGEGGMVVTDRDDLASTVRSLRNQGRAPGDTWLDHTFLGYNYRMDELNAALGHAQMGRLDELMDKRDCVAAWYAERLAGIPGIAAPVVVENTTRMSWFVYVVRFDSRIDRDEVMRRLDREGIPSRPYFKPIHLQPYVQQRFGTQAGDFPIAEDLGRRGLALPFSSVMQEDEVSLVCEALRRLLA